MENILNEKQALALVQFTKILYINAYKEIRDPMDKDYDPAITFVNSLLNNIRFTGGGRIEIDVIKHNAVFKDSQLYWNIIYRTEMNLYDGNRLTGISLNEIHDHYKTSWLNEDCKEVLMPDGFHKNVDKYKGLLIKWNIDLNHIYIPLI